MDIESSKGERNQLLLHKHSPRIQSIYMNDTDI